MNFLNENLLKLCEMQANLFAQSAIDGIPSKKFIKNFMQGKKARMLDDIYFPCDNNKEDLMFSDRTINKKRGLVYSGNELHWIGFMYRYWACIKKISSVVVYHYMNESEMKKLYPALHTADPAKALNEILSQVDKSKDLNQALRLKLKALKKY